MELENFVGAVQGFVADEAVSALIKEREEEGSWLRAAQDQRTEVIQSLEHAAFELGLLAELEKSETVRLRGRSGCHGYGSRASRRPCIGLAWRSRKAGAVAIRMRRFYNSTTGSSRTRTVK